MFNVNYECLKITQLILRLSYFFDFNLDIKINAIFGKPIWLTNYIDFISHFCYSFKIKILLKD